MWLEGGPLKYIMKRAFVFGKNLPIVKDKINEFVEKFRMEFRTKLLTQRKNETYVLAEEGVADDILLKRCQEEGEKAQNHYSEGKLSGCVFSADKKHWDVVNKAMVFNCSANPLFFNDFAFSMQCEAEVVRMCIDLYNGDDNACGIHTNGGSDSIFTATNAYKQHGLNVRGITKPNMVAPITAHPGIDKACHYLGIEVRKVPNLENGTKVNMKGLRRSIDRNTLFIYASAPDFGHGNFDPLEEISDLALEKKIGMHADCCLGGFINPFIERAGYKLDHIYDFRLKGITTISCDTHKYGNAPKGSSVCMFRSRELRNQGIYTNTEWTGGFYATTGTAGSRNGSIVIGAWTAMMRLGRKG
jgi:sphinganine-1-phosphate aldolase